MLCILMKSPQNLLANNHTFTNIVLKEKLSMRSDIFYSSSLYLLFIHNIYSFSSYKSIIYMNSNIYIKTIIACLTFLNTGKYVHIYV